MSAGDAETPTGSSDGPGRGSSSYGTRILGIGLALALFGVAWLLSAAVTRSLAAVVEIGEPGTVSRLVVGVTGLQIVGFGGVALVFLQTRTRDWRSYLRLGPLTEWVLFYGVAVGLALMVLTVVSTVVFTLLDIAPAESATGQAEDPLFYVVLLVVSTVVVVPMEELFFRGIVQRYLVGVVHPSIAIGVASVLFASVHASVSVGEGGELLALLLFVSFGVALGISYHRLENLLVPVIGHAMFNAIQILVRTLEVAA